MSGAQDPHLRVIHGVEVYGVDIDAQSRCAHYHDPVDVISLKFGCCSRYYPCHLCHDQTAGHAPAPWPKARQDESSVLCGVCGHQLSADQYLGVQSCPECGAAFNPGCKLHRELYFES